MHQAQQHPLSIKDYLAGELESDIRHEFYDGSVYAMAGAGRRHNIISLNIATLMRQKSRATDCRTFVADMKLYLSELNRFYYPDILLSCDKDDTQEYYCEKPCLVVECSLHPLRRLTAVKSYMLIKILLH
jgi:Uma2 family endonuclease